LREDEVPFPLPKSWIWVRLGDCFDYDAGIKRDPKELDPEKWLLELEDIEKDTSKVLNRFRVKDRNSLSTKSEFETGDILYGKLRPYLNKVVVADEDGYSTTEIVAIRPFLRLHSDYCALALRRPDFVEYVTRLGQGTKMPRLRTPDALRALFPLPPLAEQRRIVARVDELMALCDRLEAARAAREATRERMAAATLARLAEPTDDSQQFHADAAFALRNLAALTTRPEQVKALRQAILNLAVRGKLVPQDPNDEPASELLRRISLKRKKRQKFAPLNLQDTDITLPPAPENWIWTTIDQVSDDDDNAITDGPFGSQLKTEHYINTPGFRVIRLQNIGSYKFREEYRSYIDQARFERLSKHHVRSGDLVVAGLVDPNIRCCEIPDALGSALVKADCYRLAVHPDISSRFVLYFLNSPLAQEFATVHHHGMTLIRIGLGNFRKIPIPLPPLAEQRRIVARVDELMALCDALEASLQAGDDARRRLLEAVLHGAL
jgi:type I restriction enzyme S subunit